MSITEPSKTMILLHEFFWFKLLRSYYRSFVNSFDLRGDEKVLDFGCGPGAAAKFIAPSLETEGGVLTCLDISKTWIERAKKNLSRFSNIDYYAVDIREWEKEDQYFDLVAIHFVLHDIPKADRGETAHALSKKMKTGASLIIREPAKEGHGMPPEEIKELMLENSLNEISSETEKRTLMGRIYTGFYSKT